MAKSISELQDKLFGIPPDIISPIELSKFLKGKLGKSMEENVHLKQYILDVEEELDELREFKQQNIETKHVLHKTQEGQPAFTSKFLEMSKKNRNMAAEIGSLKSRIRTLVTENEKIRGCLQFDEINTDTANDNILFSPEKSEAVMLTSQQLTHVTNKMIEYRRQCQQMKIDLRHMTKALCQEIGEGVTIHTVSNVINSSNWRGRQQQIIALQQKIVDQQTKLANCQCQSGNIKFYDIGGGGEGYFNIENDDPSEKSARMTSSEDLVLPRLNNGIHLQPAKNSASQRPFLSLHLQELKKHEQLQKLSIDIKESKTEIEFLTSELKASKARCKTLDAQVKTLRFQVNESSTQLQDKQRELENSMNENKQLNQELRKVKSREINSRGQNCAELHEVQLLLSKERAMVNKLQNIISENQETLANLDKEKSSLEQKLDAVLSSCSDGIVVSNDGIISKIASLETELSQAARIIETSEMEHRKLIDMIKDSSKAAEEEKGRLVNIQLRLSKAFAVLERADECILQCLDGAQICDEAVLIQVEETRALMRELKIGELFSLEMNAGVKSSDAKNLNTHVSMLKKELVVLKEQFQKVVAEKKRDLRNFTNVAEEIRKGYLSNFPIDKYLNLNISKEDTA